MVEFGDKYKYVFSICSVSNVPFHTVTLRYGFKIGVQPCNASSLVIYCKKHTHEKAATFLVAELLRIKDIAPTRCYELCHICYDTNFIAARKRQYPDL